MSAQFTAPTNKRSDFVTVVAWIFIALSGFSTLMSIAQNILVQTVFSTAKFNEAFSPENQPAGFPPIVGFMASDFRLIFAAVFVASAATLISSIGLLKRRNWARLLFIVVLALGIAWNLAGVVLQLTLFSQFSPSEEALRGAPIAFKSFFIGTMVVSALFAVGMSALFGWLIKRLVSPAIVAEFRR